MSLHEQLSLSHYVPRLIFLSLGKVPIENLGAYCVSKHGVEAYSNVLRLELGKWGIKVSVVQPSGYNTGMKLYFLLLYHLKKIEMYFGPSYRAL